MSAPIWVWVAGAVSVFGLGLLVGFSFCSLVAAAERFRSERRFEADVEVDPATAAERRRQLEGRRRVRLTPRYRCPACGGRNTYAGDPYPCIECGHDGRVSEYL